LLGYPSLALDQLLLLRLKSIAGAELVLSLAPRVLLPVACRPGLLGCVEGLQSIQAGLQSIQYKQGNTNDVQGWQQL
jgi:hypothetical protein